MPTTTTNLGLIKPTTGEHVLISDLNTNADLIDAWATNPDVHGTLRLRGDIYDANNKRMFQLNPQPNAFNYLQVITGAAGNGVSLTQQGDAKGQFLLGVVGEATQNESDLETGPQINLAGHIEGVLNNVLQIVPLWDGVNHGVNLVRIQSGVTGNGPRIVAVGPDPNVDLKLGTQALGVVTIGANMTNNKIARFISVLSALNGTDINNVTITNALAGGAGPVLATEGADTNIDLNVIPKGTGRLVLTCALAVGVFNSVHQGTFNMGSAFASRATTNPSNAINLFNGTAPVGALTNGVTLYAQAGKLWAMDAAGTATQLTP